MLRPARQSSRCKRVWILLLLLTVLAGCSRVEFIYERLDWFGARAIAGFLDLDRDQRNELRDELSTYREFHREHRVPEITRLLGEVAQDVENDRLDRERLVTHLDAADALFQDTARDLLPIVTDTLSGLSTEQVAGLRKRMEEAREENQERREEKSPEERREAAIESSIEGIENWTGRLNEEQREFVAECQEELPQGEQAWQRWQEEQRKELLELLERNGYQEEIRNFLVHWWLEVDERPANVLESRDRFREVWVECIVGLVPRLEDRQRERVVSRLEGYRGDLEQVAAKVDQR